MLGKKALTMLHQELKILRHKNRLTLKELSSRVGYGTGNLSSYENGRLHAKDATVLRILTRGYRMTRKEAQTTLALWRTEEVEDNYKLQLAQAGSAFNKGRRVRTLEEALIAEGLNRKEVEKVLKMVETLRAAKKARKGAKATRKKK